MDYNNRMWFHVKLLALLAERLRPTLYVELGVGKGKCLNHVYPFCGRVIGVDKVKPKHVLGEFYEMTTDQFAADILPYLPPIELLFIDADHCSRQLYRDVANYYEACAVDSLIILHDTYPANKMFLVDERCSDAWRVPKWIDDAFSDLEVMTLPTPPGLTICHKQNLRPCWLTCYEN